MGYLQRLPKTTEIGKDGLLALSPFAGELINPHDYWGFSLGERNLFLEGATDKALAQGVSSG
jgi:hypothetical protein